ncbi:hypothetical protein [Cohnella sp. JJ-181]|uniref:hypothetical protein n=1 Tax=Cohnella rhizoplanae TaxID=2974897 RepID=UPI0022FFB373|nr:hypothetical protein [Cohnella sp. JJ-181]CAI6085981.1 hypothetical protein COHCIP112018_04859 [Cohnella sp. JJ-181]
MANTERPDLKMVGTTSSNGGVYKLVKITGECEINGDLYCGRLACTGEMNVRGKLNAEAVRLTGVCGVEASLASGEIRGTGEVKVKGSLRSEKIKLDGQLSVDGNADIGEAELRGGIVCGGLLTAERLDLSLFGPSTVRELGGGRLRVRRSRISAIKNLVSPWGAATLTAGLIEGDQVELQYTEAEVVRGGDVAIGPGCRIGRVEYRRELRVASGSTVGERVRI